MQRCWSPGIKRAQNRTKKIGNKRLRYCERIKIIKWSVDDAPRNKYTQNASEEQNSNPAEPSSPFTHFNFPHSLALLHIRGCLLLLLLIIPTVRPSQSSGEATNVFTPCRFFIFHIFINKSKKRSSKKVPLAESRRCQGNLCVRNFRARYTMSYHGRKWEITKAGANDEGKCSNSSASTAKKV